MSEIFQEIRTLYLKGKESIDLLLNIKADEFKLTLDTGKSVHNIEAFLKACEMVVKHKLQVEIQVEQMETISRELFLHQDLID